jgi:hypothetical protein
MPISSCAFPWLSAEDRETEEHASAVREARRREIEALIEDIRVRDRPAETPLRPLEPARHGATGDEPVSATRTIAVHPLW